MGYNITIDPSIECSTKSMEYLNRIVQAREIIDTYLLYCPNDVDNIYFICQTIPTQNIIVHPKLFFMPQTFFGTNTRNNSITISFDGTIGSEIYGTNLFEAISSDEFNDMTDESKRQYLLSIA